MICCQTVKLSQVNTIQHHQQSDPIIPQHDLVSWTLHGGEIQQKEMNDVSCTDPAIRAKDTVLCKQGMGPAQHSHGMAPFIRRFW